MSKFEPGDVVVLRSGSVPMTVAEQDGDVVRVEWFVGPEVRRDGFLAPSLVDWRNRPRPRKKRPSEGGRAPLPKELKLVPFRPASSFSMELGDETRA